jgi:hypothetical protein
MVRTAEQQRLYRQKLMKEMGEDAYKALEAKRRRESRLRKKAMIEAGETPTREPYRKVIDRTECIDIIEILKKKKLKDITIKDYLSKASRVYFLLHRREWDCKDISWLKNYDRVIDYIQHKNKQIWRTQKTRNTYLIAIASLVSKIPELKSASKHYNAVMKKANEEQYEQRLKQGLKPEWKEQILTWDTILNIYNTAEFKNDFDKLIYSIFTLIPPRRSGSYYDLLIKPQGYKSDTENYIIIDSKKHIKSIILNRYKTAEHYGQYKVVRIPKALKDVFNDYLKNKDVNQYVFINHYGKPYDNKTFGVAVSNVFKRYTNRPLGSTLLRISYASNIVFGGSKKASLSEMKKHADKLGHGLEQFQQYARFGVND